MQVLEKTAILSIVLGLGVLACNDGEAPPLLAATSGLPAGGALETDSVVGADGDAGGNDMTAAGDTVGTGGNVEMGSTPEGPDDALDSVGTDPLPPLPEDVTLPIVFVHGFAGSAQQYESQAMRFAANGYPPERIIAYEHDGSGFDIGAYVDGLDSFVDAARAEFGSDQVYLVGHSRGTFVSSSYLGSAPRAAKVAKYISLDGSGCGLVPVPCIAPSQAILQGQAHVEVATSPESFEMQYEFLIGEAPQVVDIVQQRGPVTLTGRVVDFPANTGKDGSMLAVWELDSATGFRVADQPLATYDIGANGDFGPLTVSPLKHYEMALTTTTGVQHFYMQRFLRDSNLLRLLTGPPDSETRLNTNRGPGHAALIVSRMREWMQSDVLEIGTTSLSGDDQMPVNIISPALGNANIAIHVHDDAASPRQSTLEVLEFFDSQAFQTGVDLYMPAAEPPDGTITLTNLPRGDQNTPQVLHVPNWSSEGHLLSVTFADFPHSANE